MATFAHDSVGGQSAGPAPPVVERILHGKPHPEMGYGACLGLIRLAAKYSPDRIEHAAERAVQSGSQRRFAPTSLIGHKRMVIGIRGERRSFSRGFDAEESATATRAMKPLLGLCSAEGKGPQLPAPSPAPFPHLRRVSLRCAPGSVRFQITFRNESACKLRCKPNPKCLAPWFSPFAAGGVYPPCVKNGG